MCRRVQTIHTTVLYYYIICINCLQSSALPIVKSSDTQTVRSLAFWYMVKNEATCIIIDLPFIQIQSVLYRFFSKFWANSDFLFAKIQIFHCLGSKTLAKVPISLQKLKSEYLMKYITKITMTGLFIQIFVSKYGFFLQQLCRFLVFRSGRSVIFL